MREKINLETENNMKEKIKDVINSLDNLKKEDKYIFSSNSERNGRINREIRIVQNTLKQAINLIEEYKIE